MALNSINASVLNDHSSLSPSIVAQLWAKAMQDGVIENEWLSRFQGPEGSNMPIIEKDDLSVGGAQTMNFTVGSELVDEGQTGSDSLIGNEEKLNLNTYQLKIDWVRHGVAADRRFKGFTFAKRKMEFTKLLSRWMARRKQIYALLRLIKSGAYTASGRSNNLIYPGAKATDDALTTSDRLSTGLFSDASIKLLTLGAKPANISREEGNEVPYFILWATHRVLRSLVNDSAWNNAQLMGRAREGGADEKNPLFTGCFSNKTYMGIAPYEIFLPDHDNPKNGAIGSPLEPRALLRTATTNFTSVTDIDGGGSDGSGTTRKYFRDFPGYDFTFLPGDSAVTDSNTYYAKIIDLPGATNNPSKFEIISYTGSTGNNGNKLTAVTRNVAGTTNPDGKHDANSLIVPCNKQGVAYAHVIITGANALLRGYGNNGEGGSGREALQVDNQDYNFVNGAAVEAVFGQTPAQRRDGKFPNFVIAKVATGL